MIILSLKNDIQLKTINKANLIIQYLNSIEITTIDELTS